MLAFDITNQFVHVVEYGTVPLSNNIRITKAVSFTTPPQTVRNGTITNPVALAKEIKDNLFRASIKISPAVVSINSTSIKSKGIEVMKDTRERIIEIMQSDIRDVIAEEEHLIDYTVQRDYKVNKVPFLYCNMIAVPYSLIGSVSATFNEAKIPLKKIDIHSNALSKIWELENPKVSNVGITDNTQTQFLPSFSPHKKKTDDESAELIENQIDSDLAESESQSTIVITPPVKLIVALYKDEMKMVTNGISGSLFTKTVPLSEDDNPYSDVDLMMDEGISNDERTQKLEENRKFRLMQYMQNISSFIAFQQSLNTGFNIEEIQLYGDETTIPGITDLVGRVSQIPTTLLQAPKKLSVPSHVDFSRYAIAIGTALKR